MSLNLVPEAAEPPPDAFLLTAAQQGDEVAFARLMRCHYERVFRLVYAILRHEADARDVCQDIWVLVWQALPEFRGDAKFTTWLHPIAVRRALDYQRKRRRWYERFLPISFATETQITAPSSTDVKISDQAAAARAALDTLPARQRAVLALRELEGLSYDAIAAAMKIPVGTVMSRLHHARRHLALKLGVKS